MPSDQALTPAEIVGSYMACAIRGESLPDIKGPQTAELLRALRQLLARDAGDQVPHLAEMYVLACIALQALNTRLRAEAHYAKAIGSASLQ